MVNITMSSVQDVVTTCDWCHKRVQAIAELLLLSSDLRPVNSDFGTSFPKCRDSIIIKTKDLSGLNDAVCGQLHSITAQWMDIRSCLSEISDVIVTLTELCSHTAYLVCLNQPGCSPASSGVIDKYVLQRACIDVHLCCHRLSGTHYKELTPHFIVNMCSEISQNLSVLTDRCRQASDKVDQNSDQEQFKLCVKSMTGAASCLLAGIRSFKSSPTESLHHRCCGFSDALIACSKALVSYACEPQFVGKPAVLTHDAKLIQSDILGACMSIVSSFVQLCKTLHSLAFDNKNPRHRGRANLCLEALRKSTNQLADVLLRQSFEECSLEVRTLDGEEAESC